MKSLTDLLGLKNARRACHGCAGLLMAIAFLSAAATASANPQPLHRAKAVHTAPAASQGLRFSSTPTDTQFLHTGLFTEPLVPIGATSTQENRSLVDALVAYRGAVQRTGGTDAVDSLVAFLTKHPNSPWKVALQLNLGLIYRQTGHFSKALDVWQAGWNDAQGLTDPQGRRLANAMVAHLSQLEAYLGRKELLQPLLASIKGRSIGGTAAQLMTDSDAGMYDMLYHPDQSFRCGPLALKRILLERKTPAPSKTLEILDAAASTDHGLSLTAVEQIAANAGMNYQMAYRTAGAPMIIPAVANWKVGHYAALLGRRNGRYWIGDTTFGEDIDMSPGTLEEESSGYFLVPAGPLPKGWRTVSLAEGATVWGRGDTGQKHDVQDTGCDCTQGSPAASKASTPAAKAGTPAVKAPGYTVYSVEPQVVGLELHDTPVGYTPPRGPAILFELVYSHRDAMQPTTFSYTNFGPKWTFTWLSYITDTVNSNAQAVLYQKGGGGEPFTFSSTSATTAYPGPYSQGILTRTVNGGGASTGFTLTYPDGTSEQFGQASGSEFFMTAVSDAAGNTVTLSYDGQMRITAITDAIGQVSTISYGLAGNPLLVTQITDPFGRSASFTYNGSGQLASITDTIGITSSYTYGQGSDPDFVNTLTTPYGSTSFTYGDSSTNASLGDTRFLKITDPLGRTSYVEYDQSVDAEDTSGGVLINSALLPVGMKVCNEYMQYRNTFLFDANQYAQATQTGTLNYALAHAIHWLHSSDETNTSRFIESEKQPLENRVWYNYPAQGSGSCASIYSTVSSAGVVTNGASTQPSAIGRVLDNGNTQLQTFQYNSYGSVTQSTDAVGRQLSYTYAANGIDRLTTSNTSNGSNQLLETRTYNSQHLPLKITGANGKTSKYQYNTYGQLTKYTDPLGNATTLKYDGSSRLKSITGPISSAEYTFAYDNVSRLIAQTDPAGSTVHFTYDAADRPLGASYPDGTSTSIEYTLLDKTSFTDRLRQTTIYRYDADRELIGTTDPLGHTVQQGYNPAGQLASITDENNSTTTFILDDQGRVTGKQFADGTSLSIAYANALSLPATVTDALGQTTDYTYNADNTIASISYTANQPTPSVSFSYDPAYARLVSMTDGVGTTTYSYNPVASPAVLGANQLQSVTSPVAGTSNSDTVTYTYDALNRVVGSTVNGQAQSVVYDALGRITSEGNPLDTFTYGYSDGTTRVSEVSSTHGPQSALSYYGPQGDELLEQINIATHSGVTSLAQFNYTYNADNHVTSLAVSAPSAQTTSYTYDEANRLVSGIYSGSTPQYAYGYDDASNLTSITTNGTQQSFAYTATNAISASGYDANGSPTSLGGNTYTWDGANRLIAFSNAAAHTSSSFTYDGLGRVVRIVDSRSGAVIADHSYLWCGTTRCLAHDNRQGGSPVSTQYFNQGVIVGSISYYYIQDQLGSVTALATKSGTIAAQYAYDPYGNRSVVSGSVVSDIGYAGNFYHENSGLELAPYRAYDSAHARWLNRDPIGEAGGLNLYAYVGGNPVNLIDPLGLCGSPFLDTLFAPWGGWSSFIDDLKMLWPGDGGDWGSQLAQLPLAIPFVAPEAETVEGAYSAIADATAAGSRYGNIATDVTATEAQANLVSNGYQVVQSTVGPNGPVTVLSNGVNTYNIYASSSGGIPSAQVMNAAGQTLSKIRFGGW